MDNINTLIDQNFPSLFVISTGRCGTVTLIELLKLSPSIISKHETYPILLDTQQEMYNRRFDNTEEDEKMFIKSRSKVLNNAVLKNKVYAESTLLKFFLPSILKVLPNSKILHLYRHPGDTIRSFMRRGWYLGNKWDKHRIVPTSDDKFYEEWKTWGAFEKNCWHWHTVNDYMIKFAEKFGHDRIVKLKFEDLIDINKQSYRVPFNMVGQKAPSIELVQKVLSKPHNEQKKGEFPRYKDWDNAHLKTLKYIAGDTIKHLGYKV